MPENQTITNALDLLLLKRVRGWIEVVFRQKTQCGQLDADGRPWSRIPASYLARQLEEQEGFVVTERRIQRSLARLADAGFFGRHQRGIWRRDFWYSFSDAEWELQRCRPTAASHTATHAKVPSCRKQASPVTGVYLNIPSTNHNLSKKERKVAVRLNGVGSCAAPQGGSAGANPPTGRSRSNTPLQGLVRVVQRATARGFASASSSLVNPDPQTLLETWEESGFRFTRLASGLVVKDSLLTAPVR